MQNASNEKRKVLTNYLSGNLEQCKIKIIIIITIDYQLECMLLPLQFKLYMLELRVSPAPRKQLHFQKQSTTAETTKYMSPAGAGVLTGKTKSSRQPETTSIPVTSEFSRR